MVKKKSYYRNIKEEEVKCAMIYTDELDDSADKLGGKGS
jgi:hypothetical protein